MKELLLQILRTQVSVWVAALGTYLATYGLTVSGEMQDKLAGAVMVLAGLAATAANDWWAKRKKREAEVAAAVASAELGTPVTVTVTPAGQQNIATKVPATEVGAAPPVPLDVRPQPAPATQ